MCGGLPDARVAVYYPIEGLYVDATVPAKQVEINTTIKNTGSNVNAIVTALMKNQIDYELFDSYNLLDSEIKDGALVTPSGMKFRAVVVPKTYALEDGVAEKLLAAAQAGVKVVMQDTENILANKETGQAAQNAAVASLKSNANFSLCGDVNAVLAKVQDFNLQAVKLLTKNTDIVAVKQQFQKNSTFIFVNTANSPQTVMAQLCAIGAQYRLWNPYDGTVRNISVNTDEAAGTSQIMLQIPKNSTLFVTVD